MRVEAWQRGIFMRFCHAGRAADTGRRIAGGVPPLRGGAEDPDTEGRGKCAENAGAVSGPMWASAPTQRAPRLRSGCRKAVRRGRPLRSSAREGQSPSPTK
nr:MAG TPA: hypothetical protein [Caudoviricetes sp.]